MTSGAVMPAPSGGRVSDTVLKPGREARASGVDEVLTVFGRE